VLSRSRFIASMLIVDRGPQARAWGQRMGAARAASRALLGRARCRLQPEGQTERVQRGSVVSKLSPSVNKNYVDKKRNRVGTECMYPPSELQIVLHTIKNG
jgi:hypothetical protein